MPCWHALTVREVLRELGATPEGLSAEEAAHRLAKAGPNTLREAPGPGLGAILLEQFKSLIVWVLIFAAAVSAAFGEWIDSSAILAIVILNAIIGCYQEYRAEQSIAALKKMTAPRARIRRGGSVISVDAAEVVPGDVLELAPGDLIPADARLFDASSMSCIESALTGESEPVAKSAMDEANETTPLAERANMVYMVTSVAAGTGRAVIVSTGMDTEIGRIATLMKAEPDEQAPLQKRLDAFGRLLVWISLGIVAVIFALGVIQGTELFDLFLTAVSLAVAAVPEGLPAIVTIALSLGVMRMSRRRALIRRLASVETLGSASVICTDKTGTLTLGDMTVRLLQAAGDEFELVEGKDGFQRRGENPDAESDERLRDLLTIMAACNDTSLSKEKGRTTSVGDPTEGALLIAAERIGITPTDLDRRHPRVRELPFDSDRKLMTVIRLTHEERAIAFVKGAVEAVLDRCSHILTAQGVREINHEDRERVQKATADMAGRALRVLGAARREIEMDAARSASLEAVESGLTFVGLAGMIDPPRPEVKEAVARCRSAGIRVIMITGDHPRTALAVAREIGIATDSHHIALSGADLDAMTEDELIARAPAAAVYARVTAEHKLRIIHALRARGAVVAMTGDGVNDAPAIKGADIGIAMGISGTEVTKSASDMIIADDNFASIVAAVEEGRGIYDNIRKTLQYLLAGNSGELILMAACSFGGWPTPLLPIHLLWINLVTDGLPALFLATDPIDDGVMNRPPRDPKERITDGGFLPLMFVTGLLTAAVAMSAFLYGLRVDGLQGARTFAFSGLVFSELFRSFGCRSQTKLIWEVGLLSNAKLGLVVALSVVFQILIYNTDFLSRIFRTAELTLKEGIAIAGLSLMPLAVLELAKIARRRKAKPLAPRARMEAVEG